MDDQSTIKSFFMKVNRIIGKAINAFEVFILCIGVGLLALLLMANVIAREFFTSIYFAEEVSEFLVIMVTFVGLSYGVRKARHIRMGAFLDLMPARLEKIFIIIIAAVSAVVMFIMADASYDYLMYAMHRGHKTPALWLPTWMFYIIVPIGFFSAGVQYIRTVIKNLVEKDVWMSPEEQSEFG